ncbi:MULTISPECIES: hypothetical protein [Actinocorallia]|uniref:Uncharacterized protein n=2 Tax=Actinocorallia TaxID=58108 RepID=A0ABP6H8G2_9ACTN
MKRALGTAGHLAGLGLRYAPGAAGAALIAWGMGMIWLPLGVIVAGLALLLVDRRIR